MKTLDRFILGAQALDYVLHNWKAIEAECLDSEVRLPAYPEIELGTPFSASETSDWLYKYQTQLHYLLLLLSSRTPKTAANNLSTATVVKYLSDKIEGLKKQIRGIVALSEDSFGLLDTFNEDFATSDYVDPDSMSLYNQKYKLVTPNFGTVYRYKVSEILSSFSSQGSFSTVNNRASKDEDPVVEIFKKKVYQHEVHPVDLLLRVYAPMDGNDYRYLEVILPTNNGIEEYSLSILYKSGREDLVIRSQELQGAKISFLASEAIDQMRLKLISTKYDGSDPNGFYHLFSVDSVSMSTIPASAGATFLSKPIPFGESSKFYSAFLTADYGSPEGTPPYFYVSGKDDKGNWSKWRLINPKTHKKIHLSNSSAQTNTENKATMSTASYSSNKIAKVNWSLTNCFCPTFGSPTRGSESSILDLTSLVALRDVNSLELPSDTTAPAGWLYENDSWSTYFYLASPMTMSFGTSLVELDGTIKKGDVLIPAGIHKLRTTHDYFRYIQKGLSLVDFKKKDVLYPFNVAYLISGYEGVPEYPGIGIHGKYLCQYVDPDIIKFGEYNASYISFETSGSSLYPVVQIKPGYSDFSKELIAIWGNVISAQEYFTELKLKVEFPTATTVGSYIRSYSLSVA